MDTTENREAATFLSGDWDLTATPAPGATDLAGSAAPTTPPSGSQSGGTTGGSSGDPSGGTAGGNEAPPPTSPPPSSNDSAGEPLSPPPSSDPGTDSPRPTEGTTGGSSGGSSDKTGKDSGSHSSSGNKPASGSTMIELSPEQEDTLVVTEETEWVEHGATTIGSEATEYVPKREIVEIDILDNFRMPAAETLAESSFDAAGVGSGISWLLAAGFLGILAIAVLLNAPGLRKKQRKTRGDTAK